MSRMRRVSTAAALLTAVTVAASFPLSAAAGTASATGGGKALAPTAAGPVEVGFAFSAIAHDDGTASGELHFAADLADGRAEFRGDVICVTFDATQNRAWIGALITDNRSDSPRYTQPRNAVGQPIWFRVVDYGEGGEDPDDRTTFVGFAGDRNIPTSEAYCALRPWIDPDVGTNPVIKGNIQVRP